MFTINHNMNPHQVPWYNSYVSVKNVIAFVKCVYNYVNVSNSCYRAVLCIRLYLIHVKVQCQLCN